MLNTLEHVTDDVMDWNPPYERFAPWAKWRAIRQILVPIGAVETCYYLTPLGFSSPSPPKPVGEDWRPFLERTRREALAFLGDLSRSDDLRRVTTMKSPGGVVTYWSVKKSLRRMVWHELLHWKSICRIIRAYDAVHNESTPTSDT